MSLKSLRRSSLPALLAITALIGSASVARAQTVLTDSSTNLTASVTFSHFVPESMGFSFLLSDGPWNLFDITVQMAATLPNGAANTIAGSLWTDNGAGLPGTEMVALSLTGGTVGTGISPLTFSPTGTVALTANTKYWFVARTGAPGSISTVASGTNTGLHGLNGTDIARRSGDEAFFIQYSGGAPSMTVRGLTGGTNGGGGNGGGGAVPEPSEWAAMGVLGLGLTGLVLRRRRAA